MAALFKFRALLERYLFGRGAYLRGREGGRRVT
jgi:hypothetical protein